MDDVPGVIIDGSITVAWHNYSTGGGAQYTWNFAGIYPDSWSGDHNVYSKHGYIGAYAFGTGATNVDGEEYSCTISSKMKNFND